MPNQKIKLIVINKKKSKNLVAPHSNSSWKIAYADFVTAMMTLFLLLWLVAVADSTTLEAVAQYFTPVDKNQDSKKLNTTNNLEVKNNNIPDTNQSTLKEEGPLFFSINSQEQNDQSSYLYLLNNVDNAEKENFLSVIHNIQNNTLLQKYADNIYMDINNEGLRIQIVDTDNKSMFKANSAFLQPYMKQVLDIIGDILKHQPNYLSINGHTASFKEENRIGQVDPWALSANRANSVREYLTKNKIDKKQVVKIVGKADTEPFDNKNSYDQKNIRVTITLLNKDSISNYQKALPH